MKVEELIDILMTYPKDIEVWSLNENGYITRNISVSDNRNEEVWIMGD